VGAEESSYRTFELKENARVFGRTFELCVWKDSKDVVERARNFYKRSFSYREEIL